jgi:hypothetical protein
MATRPVRKVLTDRLQAWDADVDVNFEIITDAPFPIAQFADFASLEIAAPAANYDECICLVSGELAISDGVSWGPYRKSANVPDSTATTVADLATDFNSLLSALQAAGIMATS